VEDEFKIEIFLGNTRECLDRGLLDIIRKRNNGKWEREVSVYLVRRAVENSFAKRGT